MTSHHGNRAYHEAGHAVALHVHNLPLQDLILDAIPDAEELSPRWMQRFQQSASASTEAPTATWLFCLVAGEIAESIYTDRHWNHQAPDVRDALAVGAVASEGDVDEAWALLTWMLYRTRRTLREPDTWRKVEAVVRALITRGSLTSDEVRVLIAATVTTWTSGQG